MADILAAARPHHGGGQGGRGDARSLLQRQQVAAEDPAVQRQQQQQQQHGADEGAIRGVRRSRQAQPPPIQESMDHPRRMMLLDEEREWATTIKQAVEADPEIDNLPDFWYCHLAFWGGHDGLEDVLQHAQHLQQFRQEYGIRDTVGDAMHYLRGFFQLHPRHVLGLSFHGTTYGMLIDLKGFRSKELSSPDRIKDWLCTCYYLMTALSPDFSAIRQGAIIIAECKDYDWTQHFDIRTFRRLWYDLVLAYPIEIKSFKPNNAGMFANLMFSMINRLFSTNLRTFDLEINGGGGGMSLDELCLQPSVKEANARVLSQFEDCFQRRYRNEKTFSLTKCNLDPWNDQGLNQIG